MAAVEIRPLGAHDRLWVRRVVSAAFVSPRIVSRGVLYAVELEFALGTGGHGM